MTDKQNFAKDINVPSKEQIIIDNSNIIDVTNCKYYNNGWCELPESRDDVRNKPCGDMTLFDCYFKELARKTQECDFWKHQAELGSETTDRLAKQLEEREQECEALKSEAFARDPLMCSQIIKAVQNDR